MNGEWLQQQLSRTGVSQAALARDLSEALGRKITRDFINKIIMGRRRLQVDEMQAAARILEAAAPSGENEPVELTRVPDDLQWRPEPDFAPEGGAPFSGGEHYKSNLPNGTPEIDGSAGAGFGTMGEIDVVPLASGGTISGHRVIDEWVLPKTIHREMRTTPRSLVVMAVDGESMSPTLEPDDRIFIDTARSAFTSDGIYLIDDGDGFPRVKRLQKVLFSDPPEVVVISDNKSHGEQTVNLSRLRILGRVCGRLTRM